MLEIFSELVKFDNKYHLIYVGQGVLEKEVKESIDKLEIGDKITRIKYTNEVDQLMKISDVFLLPSLYEGMPIVLVEAQASNLKCFVSNTITEMSSCGLCIYISLDKDAKAWAKIIHDNITKDDMKLDCERLNKFSIETTTKRMTEIYG